MNETTTVSKSPKAKRTSKPSDSGNGNGRAHKDDLRLPQIRVLRVLSDGSVLSRAAISSKCGNKTTVVVGRAVGYSDSKKRVAFENTKDGGFTKSLLSLGYVSEVEIDLDGSKEICVRATAAGKRAYQNLGKVKLPPLRD